MSEDVKINFRFKDEHYEMNYPQRLLDQAAARKMSVNNFARQKLIESLDDDRLDHLTALLQQLHSKVRKLEESTDELRLNQKKAVMAILIHVCDLSPDQALRILGGEPP
ncbi:MAG: hypothetical protein CMJ58_28455 [Planctomycetaceae bacterium]|nr:hypothetical protein [Planctomycetaceae bacterium]